MLKVSRFGRTNLAIGALILALVGAGLTLVSAQRSSAEPPVDKGNDQIRTVANPDGGLDIALPVPDVSGAVNAAVGSALIKEIPGVGEVVEAVEKGSADWLLDLTLVHIVDCEALGRSAGENCTSVNEAVDGKFEAIAIEDAGTRWSLAAVRANDLLAAILGVGTPSLVAVTHDATTPEGAGGTYFLAFETEPVDAGAPRFGYAPGVVGTGFGLKVVAGSEDPVVEFSLLSADWNPLRWLQWSDTTPNHRVIFPPDLNERYPEMYEYENEAR